jgi:hypothetical protein
MTTGIQSQGTKGKVVRTGTVIAVCYSDALIDGVGKKVHQKGQITRWGLPGDIHYGETRVASKTRQIIPNDRPITVVGVEAAREICERLGIAEVPPGGLGENLLVEGAGDLGDLLPGDEIRVIPAGGQEPGATVQVRLQNDPCANLSIYHKQMVKELYGKRGVICTVAQEGPVQVGDRIEIVRK